MKRIDFDREVMGGANAVIIRAAFIIKTIAFMMNSNIYQTHPAGHLRPTPSNPETTNNTPQNLPRGVQTGNMPLLTPPLG